MLNIVHVDYQQKLVIAFLEQKLMSSAIVLLAPSWCVHEFNNV